MRPVLLFLVGLFLCFSCEDHFYTDSYETEDGWKKNDTLMYSFIVDEPQKDYNIQFIVRNNNEYPFRNLILFTELEGNRDTLYYELANQQGHWYGKGLGENKELILQYKTNYHFKNKGDKILKINQAMRKDTLYGIVDFSVMVDKTN